MNIDELKDDLKDYYETVAIVIGGCCPFLPTLKEVIEEARKVGIL